MTKHHKIVSLQLSEEIVHLLTAEAQAAPFCGNISAYLRSLIESRHDKTVIASPQAQALIDHYEQQLVALQQAQQVELADQQQHHQQEHQAQGQAHQETLEEQRQLFQQQLEERDDELNEVWPQFAEARQNLRQQEEATAQLQEAFDELDVKYQVGEAMKVEYLKALATRERQLKEWQEKHKQLADQLKQLKREQSQKMDIVGSLGKGLNGLATNPVFGPIIADHGLHGLLYGKPKETK